MIAVGVDVLAEEGDLFVTAGLQVAHFVEDGLHVTAALASAGIGHDAVGAEIITTAHDGHETADRTADTGWDDLAIGLGGTQFYIHRLMALFALREQVGDIKVGIGTRHEVHAEVLNQFLTHTLSHAADDADDLVAILDIRFAIMEMGFEFAEAGFDFLLGVIADGAGVEHEDVGVFPSVGQHGIRGLHNRRHYLTVRHVHLAAVGLYVEFFCHFR